VGVKYLIKLEKQKREKRAVDIRLETQPPRDRGESMKGERKRDLGEKKNCAIPSLGAHKSGGT